MMVLRFYPRNYLEYTENIRLRKMRVLGEENYNEQDD